LSVLVDTWNIEDDGAPSGQVGDIVVLSLIFIEVDSGPGITVLDAWAEEAPGARRVNPENPVWETVLRGDGWVARWNADRPVSGPVRVTGRLKHDPLLFPAPVLAPTRGRVVRLQYLEYGKSGRSIDVSEVEQPFPAINALGVASTGINQVQFTLELDRIPSTQPNPEGYPTFFSGFAVSGGRSGLLWRLDSLVPLVWCTDLSSGESMSYVLPLRINESVRDGKTVQLLPDGGCLVKVGGRWFAVHVDGSVVERSADTDVPETGGDYEVDLLAPVMTVVDPADGTVVLETRITGRPHIQIDDESTIWVADTRLRLFRRDGNGAWSETEVTD